MAENEEDTLSKPGLGTFEADLTDETQDFRFLSSFSKSEQSSFPKRGEKDFEPHGTEAQGNVLTESRTAMHNALSHPRNHPPKSHIVGYYNPETSLVTIQRPKGQHFKHMGKALSSGGIELLPEEAIYLLERGSLDIRWPQGEACEFADMSMSLQSAYALLIGRLGLSLERYSVYAALRRNGYILLRSPQWHPFGVDVSGEIGTGSYSPFQSAFRWLYSWIYDTPKAPGTGPCVRPGLYRSYIPVFQQLNQVPRHIPRSAMHSDLPSATKNLAEDAETSEMLLPCYYVWKPRPDFRKSSAEDPDFYVAVVDARESNVPDMKQLDQLLSAVPYSPPPAKMQHHTAQKLKHGYKSVILAIVDSGVISYIRLSDAGFSKELLYERAPRRGNKGGRPGGKAGQGKR